MCSCHLIYVKFGILLHLGDGRVLTSRPYIQPSRSGPSELKHCLPPLMPALTIWFRATKFGMVTDISRRFKAFFQVNLGQPVFIEAKDDGGGGDKWTTGAISRTNLQSNHHHQQTNIQFFYRPDALPVAQLTVSKH